MSEPAEENMIEPEGYDEWFRREVEKGLEQSRAANPLRRSAQEVHLRLRKAHEEHSPEGV